jgi:hypothetical protein
MSAVRHLLFLVLALLTTLSPASANDFVKNVTVKVQTSKASMAGTDNDVFLRLVVSINGSRQTIEQELDIGNVDNSEQGQQDDFTFPATPSRGRMAASRGIRVMPATACITWSCLERHRDGHWQSAPLDHWHDQCDRPRAHVR